MTIISIDLPWKEDKKGRRTLAIADLRGNIKTISASDDNELLELLRDNAEPGSIILLDIPIDGCDNLEGKHFRPTDKSLASQGISILPTSKAKDRGKVLKERIQDTNRGKKVIVQEVYPYATYKFLAYLKDKKLLQHLALDKFHTLLDDGFRTFWPLKYKRERDRTQRVKNMKYLYSLVTNPSLGLKFLPPLGYPDTSYTLHKLNELCDEYDACLGAIVGICYANNSSHACIAGDSSSGNILILADLWLAEQIRLKSQFID